MRGGFTSGVPKGMKMPKVIKNAGIDLMLKGGKAAARKLGVEVSDKEFATLATRLLKTQAAAKLLKVGRDMISTTTFPELNVAHSDQKPIPVLTNGFSLKSKSKVAANNRTIRSSVRIGTGLSSTMRMLKKQNGCFTDMVYNSLQQDVSGTPTRKNRTIDWGLNERATTFFPYTDIPTCGQVWQRGSFVGSSAAYNASDFAYQNFMCGIAGSKNVKSITNTSNYLPVNVKLTVFASIPPAWTANDWTDVMFSTIAGEDDGALPRATYLRQIPSVSGFDAGGAITLNLTSGVKAASFDRDATVITSQTRKLQPNDTWEFTVNETYKNGIDLWNLFKNVRNFANEPGTYAANKSPLSYMIMMECWGDKVECVKAAAGADNDETYILSSNGSIVHESQISYKFIPPVEYIRPTNSTTPYTFPNSSAYVIRGISKAVMMPTLSPTYVSVPPTQIAVDTGTFDAARPWYIPVTTDMALKTNRADIELA